MPRPGIGVHEEGDASRHPMGTPAHPCPAPPHRASPTAGNKERSRRGNFVGAVKLSLVAQISKDILESKGLWVGLIPLARLAWVQGDLVHPWAEIQLQQSPCPQKYPAHSPGAFLTPLTSPCPLQPFPLQHGRGCGAATISPPRCPWHLLPQLKPSKTISRGGRNAPRIEQLGEAYVSTHFPRHGVRCLRSPAPRVAR